MKKLRVQDGLNLTTAHMEWAVQSLIEALKDRIKDIMVKPGILSIGFKPEDADSYPLSSFFEVSQGTNAGTIKVKPGIAYDADAEKIQIDAEVDNISVPADGETYFVVVRHRDVDEGEISQWWPGYPKPGAGSEWKRLDGWEIALVSGQPDDLDVPIAKVRRDPSSPDAPVEIVEDLRKENLLTLRLIDLPEHSHSKVPIEDNFYDFPHDHDWEEVWEDREQYIPRTLLCTNVKTGGSYVTKVERFLFFNRANRLGALALRADNDSLTVEELMITAPPWLDSPADRETVLYLTNLRENPLEMLITDDSPFRPGIWELYVKFKVDANSESRLWIVHLEPAGGTAVEEDPPSPY